MKRPWSRFFVTAALLYELTADAALFSQQPPEQPLGIDVSHHSGAVDWKAVHADGYDFVYLKATEGVDAADPTFRQRWAALGQLDLARGAYHFYVTEDDPKQQAEFFLSQVNHQAGDLIPVVDIEMIGHGTTGDLVKKLHIFLDLVEQQIGVKPILYTSPAFWDQHLDDSFSGYPLWVAEYQVDSPKLPQGWSTYLMWQFAGDAEVAGVEHEADLSKLGPHIQLEDLRLTKLPHPSTS